MVLGPKKARVICSMGKVCLLAIASSKTKMLKLNSINCICIISFSFMSVFTLPEKRIGYDCQGRTSTPAPCKCQKKILLVPAYTHPTSGFWTFWWCWIMKLSTKHALHSTQVNLINWKPRGWWTTPKIYVCFSILTTLDSPFFSILK